MWEERIRGQDSKNKRRDDLLDMLRTLSWIEFNIKERVRKQKKASKIRTIKAS